VGDELTWGHHELHQCAGTRGQRRSYPQGCPRVWDQVSNQPKPYRKRVKPALLGKYRVNGKAVRTGLQVLADEVAEITPGYAKGVKCLPAGSPYEKVADTVAQHGIENIDLDHYRVALSPLPRKEHAFPTPHREAEDYPMYLMTYKRMYRNQAGNTAQNPILNRLGDSDENFLLINRATAESLGIADDDQVRIETRVGSAQGKARLSEGIRPDVVAVSYHYGHFSPGFPDYAKKGIWINPALELHPDVISGMNSFNDTKCKVIKV